MHRHIKAWGKNGQCHWAFPEPAGHGQHHVKGLLVAPSHSKFLSSKITNVLIRRKSCNTAKGETKIQESEICTPSYITIFTVQLEQRCFRRIVFGNYTEGRIKETGAALCIHKLVLSHSTFLCFQNLGGLNSSEMPPRDKR